MHRRRLGSILAPDIGVTHSGRIKHAVATVSNFLNPMPATPNQLARNLLLGALLLEEEIFDSANPEIHRKIVEQVDRGMVKLERRYAG